MTVPTRDGANAPRSTSVPRLLMTLGLALCVMNGLWWLLAAMSGQWILDARGLGNPTDFTNVYAAGRLALEGYAAQAYDWDIHKRVQEAVLGQDFAGYFGWHYPPPYLFVAAALARLPYTIAFAGWVALSAIPYAFVVRRLAAHPVGWLIALGCPLAFHNVMIGQNGFLTAALIGGAICAMPRRPWLAGLCIGLLIYKPQYGLLFPVALIAGRQWRALAGAAVTATLLIAASWLAWGSESWVAFAAWLPRASEAFLVAGQAEFGKMQSVLALCRFLGGGDGLARLLQGTVSFGTAVALGALWHSRVAFEIKAAALATAALVVTPYLYPYDMVALAIPMALLIKLGAADGFLPYELPALGLAVALLVAFPFVVAPIGLGASLLVLAVLARRAARGWSGEPRGSLADAIA